MASSTAGYSGTALVDKLGYKAACRAVAIDAPSDYRQLLAPLPPGVTFEPSATKQTDLVHLFVVSREVLARQLAALRRTLKSEASVWVSWPKKSSKVSTDVTEDVVRQVALPLGFVDIKVCAVTDVWSGLKLVVRKELRAQNRP
jgi:hypothetical protein